MRKVKKVGTTFDYYEIESWDDREGNLYYRTERVVYKTTLYGKLCRAIRKLQWWRPVPLLEVTNRVMTELYKPAIQEQLFQESILMKHLKDRRTEGDT